MNIYIRPLEEKDAYTSYNWRNNPEIWALTGSKPDKLITVEDELCWIRNVISTPNDHRFAIIADDKYIGNIYLTNAENDEAQYHIFIGEESYWGKGIATEASELLINYAKNKLKLKRIYLEVNSNHIKATKLYEKLRFESYKIDENKFLMELYL